MTTTESIWGHGCTMHRQTDCGCPGYPTLPTVLRDCGRRCADLQHTDRCLRCMAADMIDRYKLRSERYLDRIIDLQDELERATPPAGYVSVNIPVETVEQIVTTDRMFPTLDTLREAIQAAWEGQ